MSNLIDIIFNGHRVSIKDTLTISQLLQSQSIKGNRFLVVVNDETVPKSSYDSTLLSSNDVIDIINPITGG